MLDLSKMVLEKSWLRGEEASGLWKGISFNQDLSNQTQEDEGPDSREMCPPTYGQPNSSAPSKTCAPLQHHSLGSHTPLGRELTDSAESHVCACWTAPPARHRLPHPSRGLAPAEVTSSSANLGTRAPAVTGMKEGLLGGAARKQIPVSGATPPGSPSLQKSAQRIRTKGVWRG